jgi:cyd operon protein YbgE
MQAALRTSTLIAAFAVMLLITLLPRGLADADGHALSHSVLMLVMWGLSAGFVYGVGFVPQRRVWRVVFHPVVAWLGLATTGVFYLDYFLR